MAKRNDFAEIKGVIFDMDGVLFLSTDCHHRAWQETLATLGIVNFSYPTIAGMRTDDAMRKVLMQYDKQCTTEDIVRLVQQKRDKALKLLTQEGTVTAGSADVVAALRMKYRLALATSASRPSLDLFLKKSGYADAFAVVLDGSMVKHAKPAPDIYTKTIEKLAYAPRQCVVIEDAVHGVQAGVKAGAKVIAMTGTDEANRLQEAGAIHVVSHVKEIASLLL